ncbi:MAG: hypothetical protein ACKOQ2_03105 [Dolichospermum sp.]
MGWASCPPVVYLITPESAVTLIEKFELEYYGTNQENNPLSMILFLLEQSDKTIDDLQEFLGSEFLVNNILDGHEKITLELAVKLAYFFHVEASIFLV